MRTIKVGHLIAWLLLLAAVSTTICFPKAVWATQDEDDGQVIIREVPVMPDGMDDYLKPASDDDSEAGGLQWYKNNRSVLANHDIFVDVLRSIGWGLIRLLCLLANVTESLYDKTFGLIDITKYPQVDQLLIYLRPVLAALTVLCLMGLGAMLMVKQEKPQLVRNILLGILAVSCSGWIFSTANGLVTSFKDGMLGGASNANQSYTLVNDNIIDLVRVDREIGIESMDYRHGGGLLYGVGAGNDAELGLVDINETLNWRSKKKGMDLYGWSAAFNNRVKYRAVLDSAGALIAVENSDGLTSADIGNQFYYRYSFDFFSCALQLVSLTLLFCALAYKNVRIAYELVVSRILAYMYAADVSSGERLKNVLLFVRDTYITLAISVLCVKLYAIFTGAITALGVTGLGKGLVSLFIAYAVIDGPNLVERLLGMDAGLKSSFARGAAMLGAARGVARGAGAAAKGMKGLLNANADRRWQRADASRQDDREGGAHTSTSGQGQAGTGVDTDFMNDRSGNDRNGGSDRRHTATRDSGGAMPYAAAFSGNDDEEDTAPAEDRKRDAAAAERGSGAAPATGRTADLNNGQKPDFSRTAEPQAQPRPVNPAFREAVRRLSPGATAGAQERKDFNRQVNAIVRGKKHRAIQPAPDAPDYQKRNYDKALELEQAYRAYKPGQGTSGQFDEANGSGRDATVAGEDRGEPRTSPVQGQAEISSQPAQAFGTPVAREDTTLPGNSVSPTEASPQAIPINDTESPTVSFPQGADVGGGSQAPVFPQGADMGDHPHTSAFLQAADTGNAGRKPEAPHRVVNPAFREAVRRLSPSMTATSQERKDFNRQVNAIVRGKKHRAIQPAPDAPDYQKRNYDKALELEQAYRAYKPEKEKGGADNNGR